MNIDWYHSYLKYLYPKKCHSPPLTIKSSHLKLDGLSNLAMASVNEIPNKLRGIKKKMKEGQTNKEWERETERRRGEKQRNETRRKGDK